MRTTIGLMVCVVLLSGMVIPAVYGEVKNAPMDEAHPHPSKGHGKVSSLPTNFDISILRPEAAKLYIWGIPMVNLSYNRTVIIGPIVVLAGVTGINGFEVDFYIDGVLQSHDDTWPFEYAWTAPCFGTYLITAELSGYDVQDSIKVFKIL